MGTGKMVLLSQGDTKRTIFPVPIGSKKGPPHNAEGLNKLIIYSDISYLLSKR